jgi:hypothetical protein
MPLAFLLIGAVLIITAIRGTHANLGQLLSQDFTGSGAGQGHSFLIWMAAIAGVAALGYIPEMKVPARLLLALVILGLLIANKGVFAQASAALGQGIPGVTVQQAQAAPTGEALPAAIPVQLSGAGGSGSAASAAGTAGDVIGTATKILPFLGF